LLYRGWQVSSKVSTLDTGGWLLAQLAGGRCRLACGAAARGPMPMPMRDACTSAAAGTVNGRPAHGPAPRAPPHGLYHHDTL
jgi:hypothetical protein